jgi:hypothetical protein
VSGVKEHEDRLLVVGMTVLDVIAQQRLDYRDALKVSTMVHRALEQALMEEAKVTYRTLKTAYTELQDV